MGEMAELKDQAKRGGVRLPGRHWVKTAHRCVYTDPAYDMKDLLKPKNVIRVQGEQFSQFLGCLMARDSRMGDMPGRSFRLLAFLPEA